VQLILRVVGAAKAAGAHATIDLQIHVSNGELRGAEVKHTELWQPAGSRRRPRAARV
jgi:hypothetical protein